MLLTRATQGEHAVEHRVPVDRAGHVVVRPGLQRTPPILVMRRAVRAAVPAIDSAIENHGDMRVRHARIGAQATAQFKAGHVVEHPVDESPDLPFRDPAGAFACQPVEHDMRIVVVEGFQSLGLLPGQKDRNDIHGTPTRRPSPPCPSLGALWLEALCRDCVTDA